MSSGSLRVVGLALIHELGTGKGTFSHGPAFRLDPIVNLSPRPESPMSAD